jgi:ring-1,2-phenylacetyl-CoA epoxidase subunit PaaD
MRSYGLTPPEHAAGRVVVPLAALSRSGGAICPFCASTDTQLESSFGVTLCRTNHFCRSCRNPFEAFKPKTSV